MTDQMLAEPTAIAGKGRRMVQTVDPATGQPGRSYVAHDIEDARTAAGAARKAFEAWRGTSFKERGGALRRAADILRRRMDELVASIAAEKLDADLRFVNLNVRSDPRLPSGGVKHSGYGRECSGFGIRKFVNIKSVVARPVQGSTGG